VELEREIGRAPIPIEAPDAVVLALLGVLELIAVIAVVAIWREKGRPWTTRLMWSAITLVPVVGLLAFLVWGDPPPPNDPTDRPPRRYWDRDS
jgi:hypothetical protein